MTYSHTVFIVSAATAAIYLPIPIIQPTEALCKGLLLALFYAEERTSSVHITVEAQFDENHNQEAHHCEMRRWLACVTVRHILWSLAGRVSSSRRLPAFGKSWHPREWCDCVEIQLDTRETVCYALRRDGGRPPRVISRNDSQTRGPYW